MTCHLQANACDIRFGGDPPIITDIYLLDTSFVDPALVNLKCMGGSPDARGGVSHGEANNASGRRRVPSGAPRIPCMERKSAYSAHA